MRRALAAALLTVLVCSADGGSALATAGRVVWAPFQYVGGRLLDAAEVVDLNVGVGTGAKVDVKYGVNFLGAGKVRAVRAGLADGTLDLWTERDRELGLFPFSLLGWPAHVAGRVLNDPKLSQKALELAVAQSLGTQTIEREVLAKEGAVVLRDAVKMWQHTRWGDCLPLGAELHGGLVGARVMAKPLQALDFTIGFVGLDIDPWLAKTPF
jgi:hypothetical protein